MQHHSANVFRRRSRRGTSWIDQRECRTGMQLDGHKQCRLDHFKRRRIGGRRCYLYSRAQHYNGSANGNDHNRQQTVYGHPGRRDVRFRNRPGQREYSIRIVQWEHHCDYCVQLDRRS